MVSIEISKLYINSKTGKTIPYEQTKHDRPCNGLTVILQNNVVNLVFAVHFIHCFHAYGFYHGLILILLCDIDYN